VIKAIGRLHILAHCDFKKMDASNTCHDNRLDSTAMNLEIVIDDADSGNPLIKNNLH